MEQSRINERITYIAIIAILVLVVIKRCGSDSKKVEPLTDQVEIINYKDTAMLYKAKNGELITYNHMISINEESLKYINDSLMANIENLKLKKVSGVTTVKTVYEYRDIEAPVYVDADSDTCDYKASFEKVSEHFSMYGGIDTNVLTIDSLIIPNEQLIITGYKKTGTFKKNIPVVTVQNSNPNLIVNSIQDYEIKTKKKFFEKFWFQAAVGAIVGVTVQRTFGK